MAETTGLVQQLLVFSGPSACAWIGPTARNAEVLLVSSGSGSTADAAFAESLIHTLSAAATNYRSVIAAHADTDATIQSVSIEAV